MSLRSIRAAWNEFFFAPRSPLPIALFRILFGLVTFLDLVFLYPDWLNWFGKESWARLDTMRVFEPGTRINVFAIVPQDDRWIMALFWIFLAAAITLTIGFLTRASSIAVFLFLVSMQQRNIFIGHSGDAFMRVTGFFLMFAPAGAALSLDRLIRVWKGEEGPEVRPREPWAQRMIQFEMALMYFTTFWLKSMGESWMNGTALYYVFHLEQFQRFPLPAWTQDPLIEKLGSWATLAIEGSLGTLVWIKELRYYVLLAGLLLHLTLEYSMNVQLFQWVVLSSYVLFVDAADFERAAEWMRRRLRRFLGAPVTVIYDGQSEKLKPVVNVLRVLDIFHHLRLTELRSAPSIPGLKPQEAHHRLLIATASGVRDPFGSARTLAEVLPVLWPIALPLLMGNRSREKSAGAAV